MAPQRRYGRRDGEPRHGGSNSGRVLSFGGVVATMLIAFVVVLAFGAAIGKVFSLSQMATTSPPKAPAATTLVEPMDGVRAGTVLPLAPQRLQPPQPGAPDANAKLETANEPSK